MKSTISSIAAMAALVGLAQSTCTEISGNWYCNQVSEVTYENFGGSGTYNRVTHMDDTTGACNFTSYSYSGVNAPFDEELSLHIHGPIQLKQFAYYTPTTSSSKAKRDQHVHEHKHASHPHARRAAPATVEAEAEPVADILEKRSTPAGTTTSTVSCPSSNSTTYAYNGQSFVIECGFDRSGNINMVYTANFASCIQACASYSGCVDVSYLSTGGGACYMKGSVLTTSYNSGVWGARLISGSSSSSTSAKPSTSTHLSTSSSVRLSSSSSVHLSTSTSSALSSSSKPTTLLTSTSSLKKSSSSSIPTTSSSLRPSTSTSSSSAAPTATGTTWTQQSYYSSTAGTANNVVFLNNMGGGSGAGTSGVWSSYFGSSLSYASSSGTAAASSPQTLQDILLDDDEIILMTGQSCGADSTAAGGCGYFRPGIPAYHGFGGADKIFLLEFAMPSTGTANQPAIWLLNALIPRTQQYGSCTCWGNTNGCGELDIFETLSTGSTYMTSSIHGNQAGGDSDYFARPTGSTIKAAIVLTGGQLQISILPAAFVFSAEMGASVVSTLMNVVGDVDSVVTLA